MVCNSAVNRDFEIYRNGLKAANLRAVKAMGKVKKKKKKTRQRWRIFSEV